jgi:hypothetical protein
MIPDEELAGTIALRSAEIGRQRFGVSHRRTSGGGVTDGNLVVIADAVQWLPLADSLAKLRR